MSMSDYLRALKALGWLNRNTDYRCNNVESSTGFKRTHGGMFGVSKFSTKDSFGIVNGKELVEIAEREGWKDE